MGYFSYNPAELIKELPVMEELVTVRKPKGGLDFELKKKPFHAFESDEGQLMISAENGTTHIDYYGEYRGGYAYICDELEQWAKKIGGYWEWQNPGCIGLVI